MMLGFASLAVFSRALPSYSLRVSPVTKLSKLSEIHCGGADE
jgi:hypothetical protein